MFYSVENHTIKYVYRTLIKKILIEEELSDYANKPLVVTEILHLEINTQIEKFWHRTFEPIPLTEEWLLKLGFEYTESVLEKELPQIGIIFWSAQASNFKVVRFNSNFYCSVRYVHELQNLYFAITGKELTLKE